MTLPSTPDYAAEQSVTADVARGVVSAAHRKIAAAVFAEDLTRLEDALAVIANGGGDPVALAREGLVLLDRMRGQG